MRSTGGMPFRPLGDAQSSLGADSTGDRTTGLGSGAEPYRRRLAAFVALIVLARCSGQRRRS
jgi:hypothetical protein